MIRSSPIAGSWYPGSAPAIVAAVDSCLAPAPNVTGRVTALVAPHAGLKYSGPVAAYAYRLLEGRTFDTFVLVGPSHFAAFEGVAAFPAGAWETPLGRAAIDGELTAALIDAGNGAIFEDATVHRREHSLEMQLPFIQRLAPSARIVALLMGEQTAATADRLARAIAGAAESRSVLLVASSDLSHYHDASTAHRLDAVVLDCLARSDAVALQRALDRNPRHACGGGPMVAVVSAARALGARHARVLRYGDSGDVSGDKSSVVGYAAAAFGDFESRTVDA